MFNFIRFFLTFPYNSYPRCPLYNNILCLSIKKSQPLLIFKPAISLPTQIPIQFAFICLLILLMSVRHAVCIRDLALVCLLLDIRCSQYHTAQYADSSSFHPPAPSGPHVPLVMSARRYTRGYVQCPLPGPKSHPFPAPPQICFSFAHFTRLLPQFFYSKPAS